jgi:hypothetical protein
MTAVAARKAAQNLANESAAAQALRETIAKLTDDGETIRDTIEGETGLHEAVGKVMAFVRDDEILIAGIDRMVETLVARKKRLEDRVGFYRSAIEQAMVIGEIQTMELPDATVTVRRVAPKLEVVDESAIPAGFWRPQDPKLDRKAVTDALKAGQDVPGAALGNGGITLSIRRQ